ncbi:hypothetical protein BLA24_27040 [Streptomyces cinnamoneus]|uniref:Phytase-like domain-containing protein n=1 Tax=Streptomyces cinnamoneus TaxID=53446 RepID=A0A2G1XEL2_STRCJ|nr:esterase-like activity of phytase family protein [Streptomyces cinnamoneus]PHQ49668.1 hypothetical protein BLA24_27040 [Streptomyces cinnamoneus]PPT14609.1 hypothetical protein CYQ11_18590 [Streptomyces cinnamoneus]
MRARTTFVSLAAVLVTAVAGAVPATAAAPAPGHAANHDSDRPCTPDVSLAGFSDALDKTYFQGSYVGNLSALARDSGGRTAALSDRSLLFTLDAQRKPERVLRLADENGKDLDSEGLVIDRDGGYLVTSETEPSVRRYDRDGKLLGALPVPDELRVAPAGKAQLNQTFEGLTLLPGGNTLVASMEGALSGDGTDDQGRPLVRFQTWQRSGGHGEFGLGRQYAYPVDKTLGVSEVTAADESHLLVLERGFSATTGLTVRLYLADLSAARTDAGRPVPKRLLADLGGCTSPDAHHPTPQPNPLLDNVEGMTVTGREPDGRLKLLLVSDDNQSTRQVTRLYELTVRVCD